MTELKFVSPILDNIAVGGAISEHHGISCYPAMNEETGEKYILKVVSIPASRTQLDAFLLTGAYADEASAMAYFQEQAEDLMQEVKVLEKLAQLEGFFPYERAQLVPAEDEACVRVYLLSSYKQSLDRAMAKAPMTHLGAVNLGLDLCSALTVCRRSGFMFADLKPGNIYIAADNSYRIGDLGFVKLDALKYTSLSDKYRSAYTAPEIADAFSSLNTTLDTYAVGMILYQIYNNGELPVINPEQPLASPANADYEMSEIILKACALSPDDRWEDPAQMGQALVSYMQRNGANDTPIVPPVIPIPEEPIAENPSEDTIVEAEPIPADAETVETDAVEETATEVNEETVEEAQEPEIVADANEESTEVFIVPDLEDEELSNLSVLLQPSDDETAPEYNEDNITYEEISPEITEILSQADEIVAHPVPDPVQAPEAIDVPIPEPLPVDTTEAETAETVDDTATFTDENPAIFAEEDVPAEDAQTVDDDENDTVSISNDTNSEEYDYIEPENAEKTKKKSNWVLYVILAFLLLGLIAVGIYFYTNYYLLPIDSLTVDLDKDMITVTVDTSVDKSLLTVTCDGSHADVRTGTPDANGIVVFDNLNPNTLYTIKVDVSGFHKLTGTTQASWTTPKKTDITSFNVFTGSNPGSVDIELTATGNDVDTWELSYETSGENKKIVSMESNNTTITGLTVGKQYTFTLNLDVDPKNHYITGNNTTRHIVKSPAYAEQLLVDQCAENTMVVSWISPSDTSEGDWTVLCIDDNGNELEPASVYNGVRTFATFENVDNAKEYTITVIAVGMRKENGRTVTKEANATSLSNMKISDDMTEFTWNSEEDLGEWTISYTVNGDQIEEPVVTNENKFLLEYLVPGAQYCITIAGKDGIVPLGGTQIFVTADAEPYDTEHSLIPVNAKDMTFQLCTPPNREPWSYVKLKDTDFTTDFKVGEKAGLLITHEKERGYSPDIYTRLFVIYDSDGKIITASVTQEKWYKMWPNGDYCELTIPKMPQAVGEYTLHLFFNGQLVTTQDFSIVE